MFIYLLEYFENVFLNMNVINERYANHFYHDFIGRAHCQQQCDVCDQAAHAHNSRISTALDNFRSSYSSDNPTQFQPFVRDFNTDHHLRRTNGLLSHECSFEYTLPIVHRKHLLLDYAFYENLLPSLRFLYCRCHTLHNDLYHTVFQILKNKFIYVYSIFYI